LVLLTQHPFLLLCWHPDVALWNHFLHWLQGEVHCLRVATLWGCAMS
jgi:hypothetical protein